LCSSYDPQAYLANRPTSTVAPLFLQPFGSVPLQRTGVSGTCSNTVSVPDGAMLSVVVY